MAMNNRGVGLMGRFEYDEARQLFEQARAIEPTNSELIVNLAIATLNRQHEGDEDRAMQLLDDALRLDPACTRAVYCQGLLRLYLQSPELAQPCFERVAATDSHDAYAAYFLGQCLVQQRKHAEAIISFENAIRLDDKLRSAYYAASQAHRALGNDDAAAKMLAEFQALERNPQARLAEFKYSRMGPKGMATAFNLPGAAPAPAARPDGPIFLPPEPLLTNGGQFIWQANRADHPVSVTAADIDHDGDIDLFIANVLANDDGRRNAVCVNDGAGRFTLDINHPLSGITHVNAALWGDVDNDGFTDVYFCRTGPNMLWRKTPVPASTPGTSRMWEDITAQADVADGDHDSVDGALFDADHDGDLDIFVVNADGPNELLNNNLDGTFKPIAAEAGIAGAGKGSRQVLPVDLDNDRDLDIIVINNQPPHDVWINERAWKYRPSIEFNRFKGTVIEHVASSDIDADGRMEITSSQADINQPRLIWTLTPSGGLNWSRHLDPPDSFGNEASVPLWISVTGETRPNLLTLGQGGCAIWNSERSGWIEGLRIERASLRGLAPVLLNVVAGPSIVGIVDGAAPTIWRPGPGRFPFASVSFTGKQVTSDNKQIRSNASGIGTHFAARIGSNWVAGDTLRQSSGPGQSLQPVAIGLGGAQNVDFLSITWPDGVFQTELDLEPGKLHVIEETQRQLSSCPVLFGWNGERFGFITDLLGVGGIGFMTAPNEYAPSRPWENLLLPVDALQPLHDEFVLKLGEPMEEACHLDSAKVIAYDLPPGWDMTIDERMHVGGPEPTGEALFYRADSMRLPDSATDVSGVDARRAVCEVDRVAANVGDVDERFIGLLKREQALTMCFPSARNTNAAGGKRRFALLVDCWVEYPYSQTMFAASQAGVAYRAPTLEVKSVNGEWRVVCEQFGYPAGMPRQMALPLPRNIDFADAVELRIRTNQEVYFDRVAIVEIEDCPEAKRIELPLTGATLSEVGFAKRTNGPQRQPMYDYERRVPLWDTRHQRGWYTEFGRVDELIAACDDSFAIFGPGEEIEMRFGARPLPPTDQNDGGLWSRRFVLEARGWCKDMDLFTRDGETLGPLPISDQPHDAARRDELHRRFNTRFRSGY